LVAPGREAAEPDGVGEQDHDVDRIEALAGDGSPSDIREVIGGQDLGDVSEPLREGLEWDDEPSQVPAER